MTGAGRTTTATKWNANAAHPIAVAFLPAEIGSGRNCRHAITVISLRSLPIRLRHALAENSSLVALPLRKTNNMGDRLTKFANAVFRVRDRFPTNDVPREMHFGYRLSSLRAASASSF